MFPEVVDIKQVIKSEIFKNMFFNVECKSDNLLKKNAWPSDNDLKKLITKNCGIVKIHLIKFYQDNRKY